MHLLWGESAGVRMKEAVVLVTVTVALSRLSPLLLHHTMDHSIPDT